MVYQCLYSLRTARAYGQLSCAIFPFSCPYIAQQCSTLFNCWQTRLNVISKKSHRKADHMDTAILDSDRLFQTVYIPIGWFLSIGTVYSYHEGLQASSQWWQASLQWNLHFESFQLNKQWYTMYRHAYIGYNHCTYIYIQIWTHLYRYTEGIYKNKWFCNVVLCTCCLRTCSSNVWTRYIHQMYKFICVCTISCMQKVSNIRNRTQDLSHGIRPS